MKKIYLSPAITIVHVVVEKMICSSVYGVSGTGNLSTTIDDDTTDEYLSRKSRSVWDDDDDEY